MPNARKKGKKFVGAWVTGKLYSQLRDVSESSGKPASEIIADLLDAHIPGTLKDGPAPEGLPQAKPTSYKRKP